MNISRKNAALILNEMSNIIGQAMNIMDRDGIILASTDPQRVGTFHQGAAAIVENSLDELTIKDFYQYTGAREGINLPLLVNGEIVGVVGITGKPEEVGLYGRIIKRMTEILLIDSYLNDKKKREQALRERYIEEWVYDRNAYKSPAFAARGAQRGINILLPRTMVIASFVGDDRVQALLQSEQEQYGFEKFIQQSLEENRENIFVKIGSRYILMLHGKSRGQLEALIHRLRQQTDDTLSLCLAVGCDGEEFHKGNLHEAFARGEKALQASMRSGGEPRFYEDVTLELLLNEISPKVQAEFIAKVFRGCTAREVEDWAAFLQVFFDCDGSIGRTAERLFMHKNTIQYRLKKLGEVTGYDPRRLKNAPIYGMAVELMLSNVNNS